MFLKGLGRSIEPRFHNRDCKMLSWSKNGIWIAWELQNCIQTQPVEYITKPFIVSDLSKILQIAATLISTISIMEKLVTSAHSFVIAPKSQLCQPTCTSFDNFCRYACLRRQRNKENSLSGHMPLSVVFCCECDGILATRKIFVACVIAQLSRRTRTKSPWVFGLGIKRTQTERMGEKINSERSVTDTNSQQGLFQNQCQCSYRACMK